MKKIKIFIVGFFLFAFGLCLILRLYYLQIKEGEYYEALALGQQSSFEEISGQRGEIFFSGGETPLARTVKKYLIYIFPLKIPEEKKAEEAEMLSGILDEEKEKIIALFLENHILKKEVSQEVYLKIKKAGLPGIETSEFWGRIYPQDETAAQTVGFLNQEGIGQYGIEGFYNEQLSGGNGLLKKSRSPFGYLAFWEKEEPKIEKGFDITLTLNYNLQHLSEKTLREAKEKWNFDAGQIIISDPRSGKILALASLPSFDPNLYGETENLGIFLNPAVQKLFEPGSIFKPITFAAGLEENLITPDETYLDTGSVNLGGPPIYNFQKRVWGKQKMTDVLEESINTGAVFVEQKLGKELFLRYLEKFGFFESTKIGLQGETYSENKLLRRGYERDSAAASFGQGVEITPIQIIRAFGAVANKGEMMKPFMVESITSPAGEKTVMSPQKEKTVISTQTSEILGKMMESVVENGSGRYGKIAGYRIAGKTGTAQIPKASGGYYENETIHSFIGFFPAEEPMFLIFIKLDNPKGISSSGLSTGPVFKEIAKYIIDYFEIPPGNQPVP